MSHRIKIRVIHNEKPDIRLYVTALIELARQKLAEEAATAERETATGVNAEYKVVPAPAAESDCEADHA